MTTRDAAPSGPHTGADVYGSRPHATRGCERLIFIGASTGGGGAIRALLEQLPEDAPPVLIAQHMPQGFTRTFAERIDAVTRVRVAEARDGEPVIASHVYVAPGGRHLRLALRGAALVVELSDDAPVNRHRPSVEVLFDSAAAIAGCRAIGIMLTGMGRDGATAMRRMKDAGAYNYAQDEASSVVFGMPREAIAAGAVDQVLPPERIAMHLCAKLAAEAAAARCAAS